MGVEAYLAQINSPMVPCSSTQIPHSVHFIVTDIGAMQVAEVSQATYGLDYIDRTWPDSAHIQPSDINGPFIHIALFTNEPLNRHLINVLCCLFLNIDHVLPIYAGSDLQSGRPYYSIDLSLTTCVADCVATGTHAPPSPIEILDRIIRLEQCCLQGQANDEALRIRMELAETELSAHRTRLTNLERTVQYLEGEVAQIPLLFEAIRILQEQVGEIITRCCPTTDPNDQVCFQYQINKQADWQLVPGNQPRWINAPTKIRDTTPPIVTPGPLWKAKLLGDCTWVLNGLVRFQMAEWCTGKTAKLYVVYCGQRYEVANYIVTYNGMQVVTLEFSNYPIPPGCEDVHLLLEHNDLITKRLEFANIEGCTRC